MGTRSRTNSLQRVQRSLLEQVRNSAIFFRQFVASSAFSFQLQRYFLVLKLVYSVFFSLSPCPRSIYYSCIFCWFSYNKSSGSGQKSRESVISVRSITSRDLRAVFPHWAALGAFLPRLARVACFPALVTVTCFLLIVFERKCSLYYHVLNDFLYGVLFCCSKCSSEV